MLTKTISIAAGAFALLVAAGTAQAGDYSHDRSYDTYRMQQVGNGVGYDSTSHHRSRVGVELSFGRTSQSRTSHYDRPRYRDGYRSDYQPVERYHTQERYVADPYANRTEFCRYEYRAKGYGYRKVKVKRCVHVRNDLLGVYLADGWSRH